MYIYKAKDPETFQVFIKKFSTLEEANEFAEANKNKHRDVKIDSIFDGIADGKVMDYDEEAELKAMGLTVEETSEGFDWTLEDKE